MQRSLGAALWTVEGPGAVPIYAQARSLPGDHAQPPAEVSYRSADNSLVPACCPSIGVRKEKMGQCKGEQVFLPAPSAIFHPPPPLPSQFSCVPLLLGKASREWAEVR